MDTQELAQKMVKDWQKPIYNFALRWFGDEHQAADATQETFLVALRDLDQLRSTEKLRSWIFTVARRVMIRQGKRKSVALLHSDLVTAESDSGKREIERERRETIDRELAKLPEEVRAVLILHFFHDFTQFEIAEQLSIPRSTIQSQLKRGLDRLRTKLVACGVSIGVVELETQVRNSPFSAVPDSLKAKLGTLTAPKTVLVSGLVAGGIIVKLKLMALGAATLALGLGTFYMLTEEREPTPTAYIEDDRRAALSLLKDENEALKERLSVLENQVKFPKTIQESTPSNENEELAELRKKLSLEVASKKKLRAQMSRLEAQLPDNSPRSLVAKYLRITMESQREMMGLKAGELEKRRDQLTQDMMPVIMSLMSNPGPAAQAVFDALADPTQKNKDQLTTLLSTLFITKKPTNEEVDLFNKRILELSQDQSIDEKIRQDVLGHLQLDNESGTRREVANRLLEVVADVNSPLREDAVVALAKLPYSDAQTVTKTIILDSAETTGIRSLAFLNSRYYEKEDGESVSLQLMKEAAIDLRRVAYENARSIKKPSDAVRRALEDALISEKVGSLFGNITTSLSELGNGDSVPKLQSIINDTARPLPIRNDAMECRDEILQRLKE